MTGRTVENLKKVTVALRTPANAGGQGAIPADTIVIGFILGAASSGMAPFELQLAGKAVGESCQTGVDAQDAPRHFGHLWREVRARLNTPVLPRRLEFEAEIVGVDEPSQQEVIKAMAAAVGGACGTGCGCGCH